MRPHPPLEKWKPPHYILQQLIDNLQQNTSDHIITTILTFIAMHSRASGRRGAGLRLAPVLFVSWGLSHLLGWSFLKSGLLVIAAPSAFQESAQALVCSSRQTQSNQYQACRRTGNLLGQGTAGNPFYTHPSNPSSAPLPGFPFLAISPKSHPPSGWVPSQTVYSHPNSNPWSWLSPHQLFPPASYHS